MDNPYILKMRSVHEKNQEEYINEMYNKGYELISVVYIPYTIYYYWKKF